MEEPLFQQHSLFKKCGQSISNQPEDQGFTVQLIQMYHLGLKKDIEEHLWSYLLFYEVTVQICLSLIVLLCFDQKGSNYSGATVQQNSTADIQSAAPLSSYYSLPGSKILCSSGENRLGDLNTPWQAFESKLAGHIQVTPGHFYLPFLCMGADNLLGGSFFWKSQNSWSRHSRCCWILHALFFPLSVLKWSEGKTPDLNKARQG